MHVNKRKYAVKIIANDFAAEKWHNDFADNCTNSCRGCYVNLKYLICHINK